MDTPEFSIKISYDKSSERPSRVFEAMADIIKAFEQLDRDLIKHLDSKIETLILLEDIETSSLKTVLRNMLKSLPDEALSELDFKTIIGNYLVKAKYVILNAISDKAVLTDAKEIDTIEYELLKAAKETEVDKIPTYVPAGKKMIIKHIDSINKATDHLSKNDRAEYMYGDKSASFNLEMKIDYESMEDLITSESYSNMARMVLKIRKPDYLGDTQWSFKHGGKPLSAKISDDQWLRKFRNREIDVRPHDALVCDVQVTAKYDHDSNLIGTTYEIVKVEGVRSAYNKDQKDMFDDKGKSPLEL